MLSREKIGNAASELADHLRIVENIKARQEGQKELADALALLGERISEMQADLRVLKAETKFEALKEAQAIVNAVQGGLNQRMEGLSNRVAVLDSQVSRRDMEALTAPRP